MCSHIQKRCMIGNNHNSMVCNRNPSSKPQTTLITMSQSCQVIDRSYFIETHFSRSSIYARINWNIQTIILENVGYGHKPIILMQGWWNMVVDTNNSCSIVGKNPSSNFLHFRLPSLHPCKYPWKPYISIDLSKWIIVLYSCLAALWRICMVRGYHYVKTNSLVAIVILLPTTFLPNAMNSKVFWQHCYNIKWCDRNKK